MLRLLSARVRMEDYVRPDLRRMERQNRFGVYVIFQAMERGWTFRPGRLVQRYPGGPADYLTSLQLGTGNPVTETRQYNIIGQMTRLTIAGSGVTTGPNIECTYSSTQNNGRITKWLKGQDESEMSVRKTFRPRVSGL